MAKGFVYAVIRLIVRILGTTKTKIAGITSKNVSLHVESLSYKSYIEVL